MLIMNSVFLTTTNTNNPISWSSILNWFVQNKESVEQIFSIIASLFAIIGGIVAAISWVRKNKEKKKTTVTTNSSPITFHGVGERQNFIEREYMYSIMESIKKYNIIALVGPSGCGKSFSAVETAYRISEMPNPPIHIIRISLGNNTDISVFIHRILTELGYGQRIGLQEEQKIEECLRILSFEKTFIIIDNFEMRSDESKEYFKNFIEHIPSSCTIMLTTTVDDLDDIYNCKRIRINNFDEKSFNELALSFSKRYDPAPITESDTKIISRLYNCTGGSAKATSLLIGLMRYMSPNDVISHIEKAQRKYSFDKNNDILIQNLDCQHSAVWEILSETAKKLLLTMSLYCNAVTEEIICASINCDRETTRAAIEELINAFLLEIRNYNTEYRYELHQSTYLFALNRREELDTYATMMRLAEYYINLMELHPEDASAIESDIENIIFCAEWCSNNDQFKVINDLVSSAYDMFFSLGFFKERIHLSEIAKRAAQKNGDYSMAAKFITMSASTHTILGEYGIATTELNQGSNLAEISKDPLRIIYMKRCLAFNNYRQGNVESAKEILLGLNESLELGISEETDAKRLIEFQHASIDVLALLGAVQFYYEDYPNCKNTFSSMLKKCVDYSWQRAECYPKRDLAEIAMVFEADYDNAYSLLQEALIIAEKYRDYRQKARIQISLLKYLLKKGELIEAESLYNEAYVSLKSLCLDNELSELIAVYGTPKERKKRKKKSVKSYYGSKTIGGD